MRLRFVLLLLASSPAGALDFSQPLLNPEDGNKPFCDVAPKEGENCPADKIVTMGRLAKASLYSPDQQADGDTKYKRAELAQSLTGVADVKLMKEQREMIKTQIGKLWPPAYVKAAWDVLDKDK